MPDRHARLRSWALWPELFDSCPQLQEDRHYLASLAQDSTVQARTLDLSLLLPGIDRWRQEGRLPDRAPRLDRCGLPGSQDEGSLHDEVAPRLLGGRQPGNRASRAGCAPYTYPGGAGWHVPKPPSQRRNFLVQQARYPTRNEPRGNRA